jgi:branched-chain amino acid transport system permease protein
MAVEASQQPTADFRPEGAELQDEQRAAAFAGEPPAVPASRAPENRFAGSLKDSIIAGLIALALFGPLVGLQTVPGAGSRLALRDRWGTVAVLVGIVFFGRLLLNLVWWRNPGFEAVRAALATTIRANLAVGLAALAVLIGVIVYTASGMGPAITFAGYVIAIVAVVVVTNTVFNRPLASGLAISFLAIAIAMPFLPIVTGVDAASLDLASPGRRWVDLGILVLTYVMLGWGLNIVVGLAGLLDLGYVAFYAVGAYSYALIASHFGWSFWVCLPLAGLFAAAWGVILGFPVLRLRGDYLAIVTLAFGEIIRLVLINWFDLTNGPAGIGQIPRPSFFGLDFTRDAGGFADVFGLIYSPNHRIIFLYYLILALALITNFVTMRIRNLPVGRAWEALREDEIACRSLGINTTNTKLTAFAMGAMFGGFAGSFFATRQGFISPESFNFIESATILAIVVLGGLGSQIGVAIAAVVMIGGVELLRDITFLKAIFGPDFDPTQYRLLIFGLVMVAIMVWRPRGLVSTRQPSVYFKERKAVSADLVGEGHA